MEGLLAWETVGNRLAMSMPCSGPVCWAWQLVGPGVLGLLWPKLSPVNGLFELGLALGLGHCQNIRPRAH